MCGSPRQYLLFATSPSKTMSTKRNQKPNDRSQQYIYCDVLFGDRYHQLYASPKVILAAGGHLLHQSLLHLQLKFRRSPTKTLKKYHVFGVKSSKRIKEQHSGFQRGLPPKHWPCPMMLNFADQTGSGAVIMVWSFLSKVVSTKYMNSTITPISWSATIRTMLEHVGLCH